jgi:hypothetical protein
MGVVEILGSVAKGACVRMMFVASIPPNMGIAVCGVWVRRGSDEEDTERETYVHEYNIRARMCSWWCGEIIEGFLAIVGDRDGAFETGEDAGE